MWGCYVYVGILCVGCCVRRVCMYAHVVMYVECCTCVGVLCAMSIMCKKKRCVSAHQITIIAIVLVDNSIHYPPHACTAQDPY